MIKKDGKGYHGFVPILPGCHTFGMTIAETRKNLKEAILGWLESRIAYGWEIDKDESLETLETVEIPFDKVKKLGLSYA